VLIFDLNGTTIGTLIPKPPDKLEGPSALALVNRKLYVLNMGGNRVSIIDLQTAAEMKHRRTTTSQRVQFCRTDA